MHILYLTYSEQSGVIRFLTRALFKQGLEITIFNVPKNLNFNYKTGDFKFPSFKPHNLFNTALSIMQYKNDWKGYFLRTDYAFKLMTRGAQRYLKENRGRFNLILQSGVLFSSSFEKTGIPYCLYLDHTYAISKRYQEIDGLSNRRCGNKEWEILEKEVYEKADIIFTMSRFVEDSLIKDYGISPEKIRVVGAGPNLAQIPALIDENRHDDNTILFVGKGFKGKGGDVLLKAFNLVKVKIPGAKLIIVGSRKNIQGIGIENKGEIDFEEVAKIYKKASIFVLPTLREAFGLVFLEAMSYGLACIGTNIEAIPEIIDDGKTGFIVPCLDEETLAEKIILLLRDKELAGKMGQEGHKKIQGYFNWDAVASRLMSGFKMACK